MTKSAKKLLLHDKQLREKYPIYHACLCAYEKKQSFNDWINSLSEDMCQKLIFGVRMVRDALVDDNLDIDHVIRESETAAIAHFLNEILVENEYTYEKNMDSTLAVFSTIIFLRQDSLLFNTYNIRCVEAWELWKDGDVVFENKRKI